MANRRRTMKLYQDLYRNDGILFPAGPSGKGPARVTLFPNGQNEIWVKTDDGLGFRITAGNGPAGLGLTISRFTFGDKLTVRGDTVSEDADEVSVCQYRQDERSIAFKAWYDRKASPEQLALLGKGYTNDR